MFYYDPTYWSILVPAMLIAAWAQWRVSSTFHRFSGVRASRGYTGAQAAEAVLRAHGVHDVRIERVSGRLTAIGVAAHEAGHAVQYAVGYGPIKLRNAIIPVCNLGSQLSIVFILLGLFLYVQPLFAVGILLFSLAVVVQLVTLPVEFNASRRALETLESTHLLEREELGGARKVLGAAAMTYVAALLVSLAQLLRFLLAFAGRREE